MDNINFIKALKDINEDLRDQLAETKRKSLEWESIARRLLYDAKESGALNDFKINWYTNEVKEAQGTFTKETNPNNL
jgi:hypothetical protein